MNHLRLIGSKYCLTDEMEVDILVSETMKPALDKEPQIIIISNLIGKCKRHVTIIPESIKVNMVLKGKSETKMFVHEPICELINFDTNMVLH
jgi:predicted RNA methylase